jgi:hypothetical protein
MRGTRTSVGTLVTTLALALSVFGLAVAAPGREHADGIRLQSAAGAVAVASSHEGQALFAAGGMRPGQAATGTVKLTNVSDEARALSLTATVGEDVAGAGGGSLTQQLVLSVADTTPGRAAATPWTGGTAALHDVVLGSLGPQEQRTLTVTAALPLAAGNAYQGASVSLDLRWTLGGGLATVVPTATPTAIPTSPAAVPVPVSPPVVPQTPVPAPTGGGAVSVRGEQLGLPFTRKCASRRHFKITLHAPRPAAMRSAVIRVNGRFRKKVRGRKARIDLRGLPKGRVVVGVVVRATNGRTYRSKRTYRTCAGA